MSRITTWRGWDLVLANRRMFVSVCALLCVASLLDLLNLATIYVLGLAIQDGEFAGLSVLGATAVLVGGWGLRAGGIVVVFRTVHRLIGREEVKWRRRIVADALTRDVGYFHLQRSGEITNTSLNESRLASNALIAAANGVQGILTLVGIFVVTLVVTPWVWLPLVLGITGGFVLMRTIRARSLRVGASHAESNRILSNQLTELPRAIREIKLFGIEDRVLSESTEAAEGSSRAFADIMSIHHEARSTVEFVFLLAVVLGALALQSELSAEANLIPTLLFLAGAAGRAVPYLTRVTSASHQVDAHAGEMAAMADLMRGPEPRLPTPEDRRSAGSSDWRVIEVGGVSFTYPDGTRVLDDADLTIERGRIVVLHGPSGGGKSTLLDLLSGFVQPTRGRIEIDGTSLAEIDRAEWFAQIGYVPQFPYVFHGTVRENLLVGAEAGPEEVERASVRAGFAQVVPGLADGYETVLGEGGAGLSGGQRQKLAIARVLLRGPSLLLFDEPTSAMDVDSRDAFAALVQNLAVDAGIVIASHDGALTELGDEVFRVGDGRVVRGSPGERTEASQ